MPGLGLFGTPPKPPSGRIPYRVFIGPRGGKYYFDANGKKRAVPKKNGNKKINTSVLTRNDVMALLALVQMKRNKTRR